ncbi:tyrosine-protein phosphatase [Actinokineospora auranticolor]|uniref:Tyrosine phosphatase family protein n=1 Tax=Actinokineospora auranticolor TaxID=155976 RepID=A0A2S6GF56_9PSEU|nr:tyrosine-protein phosphatase [Actinokineospora auranticolor]PPK63857.1 tyrosine phosphatase family protein [Actinokineospora auranticolor]
MRKRPRPRRLGNTRPGAVVRLEAPTHLTAKGWAAVWAHGVRTVVDLREVDEGEPDLTPRPTGITTVRTPLEPVGTPFLEHWQPIDGLASPLYYPAMLAEHPERVTTTVHSLTMPDYLLDNGLSTTELAALRARLSGT